MRILQICHKMPYPPVDGGAQCIHYNTLGFLAHGAKVKIFSMNTTKHWIDVASLPKEYVKNTQFEACRIDNRLQPHHAFVNLFKKESYHIERFISDDFARQLASILTKEEFDVVILEHLYVAKYISVIRKHSKAKIVLRPQNVEYEIWERYLTQYKKPILRTLLRIATNRLKAFEQSILPLVDAVIALTPNDAALFNSFKGKTQIHAIPIGLDFSNLEKVNREKQWEHFPAFYHLGTMNWRPNEEAMEYFLEQIYPLVLKAGIKAPFYWAGRDMPERFLSQSRDQLHVSGAVDSALHFQENKAVLLVPLLSGSGIRVKILEGLALGKVIISTTVGAQGVLYENGKNILIADTPEEFVQQIQFCIQHPERCKEISKAALELADTHYHYLKTTQKMLDIFKGL